MVSKSWCFTLNNYSEAEAGDVENIPGVNYFLYGREVSSTGTPHLQGVITFRKAHRLSGVRTHLPRAHWEICRNLKASITYCKKDGRYTEGPSRRLKERISPKQQLDIDAAITRYLLLHPIDMGSVINDPLKGSGIEKECSSVSGPR